MGFSEGILEGFVRLLEGTGGMVLLLDMFGGPCKKGHKCPFKQKPFWKKMQGTPCLDIGYEGV